MSQGYTPMDDDNNTSVDANEENGTAQLTPSVSMTVSSDGKVEDVVIEVDKKPGESGLTIYDSNKKEGLEYIEDPSKVIPVNKYQSLQLMVQNVLEHIVFRLITVLLILLDLILVIIDLSQVKLLEDSNNSLEIIFHPITSYFVDKAWENIETKGENADNH